MASTALKIAGIQQADPGRVHRQQRRQCRFGPRRRSEQVPRHDGHQGPVRHQSALGFRLGRAAADRQEFFAHLHHRRLQRRHVHQSDGLPDRPQRPQLFRRARHALRGPGRHARSSDPIAARSDKQPWVLPSLDYAYIPDDVGGRRPAVVQRQCAGDQPRPSWTRPIRMHACIKRRTRARHRRRVRAASPPRPNGSAPSPPMAACS